MMQDRAEGRFVGGRAAQQVDKGILKARRGFVNLNIRQRLLLAQRFGAGILAQDQPH